MPAAQRFYTPAMALPGRGSYNSCRPMRRKREAVIGVDIGGTKVRLALFDDRFAVRADIKEKTEPEKGLETFEDKLVDSIRDLLDRADEEDLRVCGIGAGCPGLVDDARGLIIAAPNIVFLKNYPLRQKLAKKTGLPVTLANDVQAGLYGEHQLGAARGARSVIGVFLGTGVGGALIVDGRLYRGASGAAGEIGRFLVSPMGPLSGSERAGTLDDFVGRHAIAAEAATLAAKQWAPYLYEEGGTDLTDIKANLLAKSVRHGDKRIEELLRSRARLVGIVLADLVNFISPEMVVLGGGLVEALPRIIVGEAEKALRQFVSPATGRRLRVRPARLAGHSVTAGAARMAWDRFSHYCRIRPKGGRRP